jgi:hypothetical protein
MLKVACVYQMVRLHVADDYRGISICTWWSTFVHVLVAPLNDFYNLAMISLTFNSSIRLLQTNAQLLKLAIARASLLVVFFSYIFVPTFPR